MKRLMTLMMVVVMGVSGVALAGSYPTASVLNGGLGYGGYGGYGGGYSGDSDAVKMIAVGRLVRDLAGAASSLKSTWEAWGLAQKEQENQSQRRTQPAGIVYRVPVARTKPQTWNSGLKKTVEKQSKTIRELNDEMAKQKKELQEAKDQLAKIRKEKEKEIKREVLIELKKKEKVWQFYLKQKQLKGKSHQEALVETLEAMIDSSNDINGPNSAYSILEIMEEADDCNK